MPVSEIDGMVDEGLMADPILCAQDIPEFVEVLAVKQDGERAAVTLEDSFPNHTLAIELMIGIPGAAQC